MNRWAAFFGWFGSGLLAGAICGILCGIILHLVFFLPPLTLCLALFLRERDLYISDQQAWRLKILSFLVWAAAYGLAAWDWDNSTFFIGGSAAGMLGMLLLGKFCGLPFTVLEIILCTGIAVLLALFFTSYRDAATHFEFVTTLMVYFGLWQGVYMGTVQLANYRINSEQ